MFVLFLHYLVSFTGIYCHFLFTGIAKRCIEVMSTYSRERTAFGKPIGEFGQVRYCYDYVAIIVLLFYYLIILLLSLLSYCNILTIIQTVISIIPR